MGGSYTGLAYSKSLFPRLVRQIERSRLTAINDDVVISGFRATRILVDVGFVGVEDHRVPGAELSLWSPTVILIAPLRTTTISRVPGPCGSETRRARAANRSSYI